MSAVEESERWEVPPVAAPLLAQRDHAHVDQVSFGAHRRALLARRWSWYATQQLWGVVLMLLGVGVTVVLKTGRVYIYGANLRRRASWELRDATGDALWPTALQARGFELTGNAPSAVTLCHQLRMLDDDVSLRWMARGELRGMPAHVGELIDERASALDDTQVRDYRLFAMFEVPPLAAQRHRSVMVRERRPIGLLPLTFDGRALELESIAMTERLEVSVDWMTKDAIARELFAPPLVAALSHYPVEWDQHRGALVVFRDSPADPIAEFDDFLTSAAAVARAYWTDQD